MSLVSLEALDKERRKRDLREALARIKRKYLILSGKGGVGKSTVAVNLAAALARAGRRVGLLDIDLHGPSVAGALNLNEALVVNEEGKLAPFQSEYGLLAVSVQGLLPHRDQAVIWRGPKKTRIIGQFLAEVAWGELDYLFIDAPPGTGDEALAISSHIPDLAAVMISSGHRLSIDDVAKAVNFLSATGTRAAGLVDNQSFMICPHCGREITLYSRTAVAGLAERLGLPFLAALPFDPEAAAAAEAGRPVVWARPEAPFARLISRLASELP